MSKKGEIPKILPYTKFNVEEIRGDLDKGENGKFELIHENDKGEILDKKSRKVNAKGYLIDNEGNILDQRGNRVFDCDLIDDTGEIPKVFRLGLLRSDSTTSLNRFLDELENIKHNLGLDEEEGDSGFEEEEKLLMETSDIDNKSRHTSDDNSAMGDRPSNYNTANLDNIQRFSRKKDLNMESSLSSDDFDLDDPEFLEAIKEKRNRKIIRKAKYKKPKKKDVLLANAYGGVPRGAKVEKNPLGSSRSSKQKLMVAGRINRGEKSIHGDSALDIRRDRPYTKSSKKTLEVDTKINFKPAEDQRRIGDSDLGMNSMHDESAMKELGGTLMIDPNQDTLSQNSYGARNPHGLSKQKPKKKRHRTKGRVKRNRGKEFGSVAPDNLEKVYEKNVDDFLNDSDWDIESVNNRSQASYKSARSYGDKRIRGLESIYLQRLEVGKKNKKKKKKRPKFRAMQDRYLNQEEIPRDEDMTSSIFSEDRR